MNYQFWDFSNTPNIFTSRQEGTFQNNVSSYFRRPSKIVKPSSRNNSPRMSSRRRMTTPGHVPARTRSVVDHQRTSISHLPESHLDLSRPVSWHPNMINEMDHPQFSNQVSSNNFMTPYSTTEVNGLVTPMSYPMMDEPQIQELIVPLEGLSADEHMSQYGYGQDFDVNQFWAAQQSKDMVPSFDVSMYPMMNYQPWYGSSQYMMNTVPTAPTSPTYLPMPDLGESLRVQVDEPEEEQEEGEELVAMGLYDLPADAQSSSLLLAGPSNTGIRKSLKLEDAFEPSANSEDDDNDNDAESEDGLEAEDDDENVPDQRQGEVSQAITSRQNHDSMTQNNLSTQQYTQVMDNSYVTTQWHVPHQNGYGWI